MYCPWKTILPPKPKLSRLTLRPSVGTCSSLFADVQAKLAAQLQEGSADRPPRSSNNHQNRGPCPPRKRSRHTLTSRSSIRTLSFCLQHLQDEQAQTSLQQENGAVKSISRPKKIQVFERHRFSPFSTGWIFPDSAKNRSRKANKIYWCKKWHVQC